MTAIATRTEIANDWNLWNEYVNTDATMERAEFDALSTAQKLDLQDEMFGAETVELINPWSGAAVQRRISDIDTQAVAALLDDELLHSLEGADTDAEWIISLVDAVGQAEAGRLIIGS